tara:strand:+ start:304 stop:534 length:231 start_codon:yes stop_codon:yes gene_type:complete
MGISKSYKRREEMSDQDNIELTGDDINKLFEINPLAKEQIMRICAERRVKELEDEINRERKNGFHVVQELETGGED